MTSHMSPQRMRVSVTDVDAYRYWQQNEWMTEDALVDRLYRRTTPPASAVAGIKLHNLLENAKSTDFSGTVHETDDGWSFDFSKINLVITDGPHEVPVTRIYKYDDFDIELSGRADAIDYDTVIDYKTTSKPLDIDKNYRDSFQWRAYLDMLGLEKFTYVVLEINVRESTDISYKFRSVHDVDFYSYAKLTDDVRSMVFEFMSYINTRHPQLAKQYAKKYEARRPYQVRK